MQLYKNKPYNEDMAVKILASLFFVTVIALILNFVFIKPFIPS